MKNFIPGLIILLSALISANAVADTPAGLTPYSATYNLTHGNMRLGETTFELRHEDDRILFSGTAQPTGMASIVRSDRINERSELRLGDDGELITLRYDFLHKRGSRTEEELSIDFDWEEMEALSVVDGEEYRLPVSTGAMDRFSLQLRVMQHMSEGRSCPMNFETVEEDEVHEYEVTEEGRYRVKTAAGEFLTVRLDRHHGKRLTIFWSVPELDYLPVRMETRREDRRTARLDLKSLSGPLAERLEKD